MSGGGQMRLRRRFSCWVRQGALLVTGGLIGLAMVTTATAQATNPSSMSQAESQSPVQMFSAILVNPQNFARQRSVMVLVKVHGIRLVEPIEAQGQARPSEAHLRYQIDQGPIIATAATQLNFLDLGSGDHVITVQLAGNDEKPIGAQQLLTVSIP